MLKKVASLWFRVWLTAAVLLLALPGGGVAEEAHWGYTGAFGPSDWDKADPSFFMCKAGKNQTPINIVPRFATTLPPLVFSYGIKGDTVLNNGHTVQVLFPHGNTLTVDGISFELVQMHFHTPGENLYAGKAFPMEAHYVHADKAGNTAVLAVFFEEGESNADLAALWAVMPQTAGETKPLHQGFNPLALLPVGREYIYFNGSLTTPPCSEGVRWYVLKHTVTIGKEQVAAFLKCMGYPNNRPLQEVNARPVLR
ncbi:MAG: carbonic anhydrase family protein [Desulfovibrio sp.]|jgi:carbonic anhydrase|nr:carbonic anhydrase family protein [Desulfovibrio sp.]